MGDGYDDFLDAMVEEAFTRGRRNRYPERSYDTLTPCIHCRHAIALHNLQIGCTFCKCAATKGEARRWPDDKPMEPLLPGRRYLRVWQDPSLPLDTETSCNHLSMIGRPWKVVARCFLGLNHPGDHAYTEYDPGSGRNSMTPDTELRKGTDAMKKLSAIETELRRLAEQEELLAVRKAELLREKDARLSLPEEPGDDAVIKFTLQHDPHGIVYTVTAFRSRRNGAQWYTTHSRYNGPFTWDDLLSLMQKDVGVSTGARTLEFFLFDQSGKWVR